MNYRKIAFILILSVWLGLQSVVAYTPVAVYGQPDYNSNAANQGGAASADTLKTPLGITLDAAGGLYVADRDNHRVLYYADDGNSTADRVYGQWDDMTAHISNNDGSGNSGAPSAHNLSMPTAVVVDSQNGLYVTDRDNHRVLYYADDGDTTADRVFGQFGNFNTNMVNNDGAGNYGEPSADNFGAYILGITIDSQDGIYVSDSSNHRVLYFANDGNTTADRVYGQWDDFSKDARNNDGAGVLGTPSANSFNFPRGLAVDSSDGLYVADRDNNRILYFANDGNTTADTVYGQFGDFTTNLESHDGQGGSGAPSADNLSHPKSMAVGAAGGLYVADTLHHRVLYFRNDGDTTADNVIGQGVDIMDSGVANYDGSGGSGAPTMDNFNGPQGIVVASDGTIFIADTSNNRVLKVECPEWAG